jgi:membrane-associated phospholipid phosphatase
MPARLWPLPRLGAVLALAACQASAQARDTSRVVHAPLFHPSDAYVAAGFAAATIAMFPLDRHLAREVRREDYLGSADLRRAAAIFRFAGGPAPTLLGVSGFVIGKATHRARLTEISLHTTEAIVVATGATSLLKGVIGRERPYLSADTNPHRFRPFRGFSSAAYASFPSGHTTGAFATAAAFVAEVEEKWPGRQRYVAPVVFTLAAGVGLSRMYEDRHWASDVVMGAAIGTFAGLKVVRFNHTRTGNRLDNWLLGAKNHLTISPVAGGAVIALSGYVP